MWNIVVSYVLYKDSIDTYSNIKNEVKLVDNTAKLKLWIVYDIKLIGVQVLVRNIITVYSISSLFADLDLRLSFGLLKQH